MGFRRLHLLCLSLGLAAPAAACGSIAGSERVGSVQGDDIVFGAGGRARLGGLALTPEAAPAVAGLGGQTQRRRRFCDVSGAKGACARRSGYAFRPSDRNRRSLDDRAFGEREGDGSRRMNGLAPAHFPASRRFARALVAAALVALAGGCATVEPSISPPKSAAAAPPPPPKPGVDPEKRRLLAAFGGEYSAPQVKSYLDELLARLAPA